MINMKIWARRMKFQSISMSEKKLKIYFTSQVSTCPPTFNIQVNSKGLIHFSYEINVNINVLHKIKFEIFHNVYKIQLQVFKS